MIFSKVLIFSICFSLELIAVFVAYSIQKNCQQTIKQPSKTVNKRRIFISNPGQKISPILEVAELPAQDCIY